MVSPAGGRRCDLLSMLRFVAALVILVLASEASALSVKTAKLPSEVKLLLDANKALVRFFASSSLAMGHESPELTELRNEILAFPDRLDVDLLRHEVGEHMPIANPALSPWQDPVEDTNFQRTAIDEAFAEVLQEKIAEEEGEFVDMFFEALKEKVAEEKEVASLRRQAEGGDGWAMHALGHHYATKREFDKAFKWIEQSHDAGYAGGTAALGLCFLNGQGVKQDRVHGLVLMAEAAILGSQNARLNLGKYYALGFDGYPRNVKQARRWYSTVAKGTIDDIEADGLEEARAWLAEEEAREKELSESIARQKAAEEEAMRAKAEFEAAAAEAARVAAEEAEEARLAAEEAESLRVLARRAEAERAAAAKAEAERMAKLKTQIERLAAEKAQLQKLAALKAGAERLASIKTELARVAAEKADEERRASDDTDDTERATAATAAAETAATEAAVAEQAVADAAAAEIAAARRVALARVIAAKAAERRAKTDAEAAQKAAADRAAAIQAADEQRAAERAEAALAAKRVLADKMAEEAAAKARVRAEKEREQRRAAERAEEDERVVAELAEEEKKAAALKEFKEKKQTVSFIDATDSWRGGAIWGSGAVSCLAKPRKRSA